jgi:DHA2 family multidrug resistance protein
MMSVALPNFINGFGGGFVFVPLTTMAMGLLRKQEIGNAAGIYNLMRNIGGSVGIAMLTANLVRSAQAHQTYLGANLTAGNAASLQAAQSLAGHLAVSGTDVASAQHSALGAIYQSLQQQASMLAYADNFRLLAYTSLACIPLVLLLRPTNRVAARGEIGE